MIERQTNRRRILEWGCVLALVSVLLFCAARFWSITSSANGVREFLREWEEQREPGSEGRARPDPKAAYAAVDRGIPADTCAESGSTMLMWAAGSEDRDGALFLIAHGADVNRASKDGVTPLMCAAASSSAELLVRFLEHGAHVNAQTNSGETALMWAAGDGRVDNIRLLLQHGADLRLRGYQGETALVEAAVACKVECVELILGEYVKAKMDEGEIWLTIGRVKRRLQAEERYWHGKRTMRFKRIIQLLRSSISTTRSGQWKPR